MNWFSVLGFILGAAIGSFLNVCIDRLPQGQSLIRLPSHCARCGRKLKAWELIPVVSYLWLKGRCRYCGAAIPRRILAVEVGSGLLFALITYRYGFSLEFLVLAFYASLFLVLAIIDLEHGLILNRIVYPALGVSLLLAPFWSSLGFSRTFGGGNSPWHLFLSSLTGGVIFALLFLLIPLLYRESMGWGDGKMAALIGLATGFPSVLVAMVISFISGGLVAGFLLLLHRKEWKDTLPYAPFMATGALVALFWGEDLITWYLGFWG